MLHIKSNNESVVGVDIRSGTSRALGNLSFLSGAMQFVVSPNDANNLVFKDKWGTLQSSYSSQQTNKDNVVDKSTSLTMMSFVGNSNIYLDANSANAMQYYGTTLLQLQRNAEVEDRDNDAFSVRVAHRVRCPSISDGSSIQRKATFKTATVEDESTLSYKFTPTSFQPYGWDYIAFLDQNGNPIDRLSISATAPNNSTETDWVKFNAEQTFVKDGITYYVHDCYLKRVGTTLELRKAKINFTTSGAWEITFDDKIALAYKNLAIGKSLRIRFVFASSPFALDGSAVGIPSTYFDSLKMARPSKLVSSSFNTEGTNGTFTFNRQCYVSAYLNGVQKTNKALTTTDGQVTINFGSNVNEGSIIELRVYTGFPLTEYRTFTVNVADTVAPPPIVATIFLADRIFGTGGSYNDYAIAERGGIEIGRAVISSTLDYKIQLNAGVTLVTGDLVEVYAMDSAGNKSDSELYEIDVYNSTDGAFSTSLGNDSLTGSTTIT